MKKILIVVILVLMQQLVVAADSIDYFQKFQQINISCANALNASTENQQLAMNQLSCFHRLMVEEMKKKPENRELILQAALTANMEYISVTVEVAIQAGMAPLVTLMRSLEIYPQQRDQIEQGALKAGVDPYVATEVISSTEN